jgi:hypothetical protein
LNPPSDADAALDRLALIHRRLVEESDRLAAKGRFNDALGFAVDAMPAALDALWYALNEKVQA